MAAARGNLTLTLIATLVLVMANVGSATKRPPPVLNYYLQQQFGVNELGMVPAAHPAVNGTGSGFGSEVVYEFVMTKTANPNSEVLGYVRGTAICVNNTATSTTFFVQNVISFNYYGGSTLSQQGEANFASQQWEFAVVGGTGAFRNVYGYNVGIPISVTHTPSGNHIVTHYTLHLSYH